MTAARFAPWMVAAIILQLLLGGVFFLLGYSMTSSLRQGAAPVTLDVLVLALPLVAVALFGTLARAQWRAGRASLASALVLAPLPFCLLLLGFLGIF